MEIPQSCTEPQKCFPGLYEFQSQLPIQDLYYMSGNRCATQDKFGHHIGVVTYDLVPNRQNYQVSTNLLQNAAWHCQCFGLPHWPQRKGTAILHIIFKYIFNINLGIISTFFPQIDSLVQDYAILVSCASAMEISQFCTLSLEYPPRFEWVKFQHRIFAATIWVDLRQTLVIASVWLHMNWCQINKIIRSILSFQKTSGGALD